MSRKLSIQRHNAVRATVHSGKLAADNVITASTRRINIKQNFNVLEGHRKLRRLIHNPNNEARNRKGFYFWCLVAYLSSCHEKAIKRAHLGVAGHLSTTLAWGNFTKYLSQWHNKETYRPVLHSVSLLLYVKQEAMNTNIVINFNRLGI